MRGEVVGLASATIAAWGAWGVLSKLAVERIDQQVLIWSGVLLGPAVVLIYLGASGQLLPLNMHPSGVSFAVLAGLAAALGTVTFYLLLARERASVAIPMTSLYPALTVVLSVVFLREHLSGLHLLGIVCALAAVALLSR